VEENSAVKKRLILTTVHDKQRSVQIDLYRSFTKTMADALYVGSLVVENIKPRPKGEPSIEMIITSTKEGTIAADAIDLDSTSHGEHHYLNVSLKSLDEDNREYEIPDFELEQNEPPPTGLYEKAKTIREEKSRKFPWLIVILAGLVLIALCLAIWLFLFKGNPLALSGRSPQASQPFRPVPAAEVPAKEAPVETPAEAPQLPPEPEPQQPAAQPAAPAQAAPPAQTAPPPVIEAPETPAPVPAAAASRRTRPVPPVASYKAPTTIPREGASYRIRWGDTLWDISEAFYRNPWLYPRIARFNNIRNPDLIISGTTIRIPPRN
jgi:nucleoid-associated protein YgaU